MLSISRSQPSPFDPSPAPLPTMAASLPIIPRPVARRPVLSINTIQPRLLGRAASLRLDLLTSASPTTHNTFSNACEQPSTAPTLRRIDVPKLQTDACPPNAPSADSPASASTPSSSHTEASDDSSVLFAVPYKQPHNLASILANSSARSMPSRTMASSRPLFPAQKHVSFRTPLEEEITTVKYTLAHSDITSSSSTLSSITSISTSEASSHSPPTISTKSLISVPQIPTDTLRPVLAARDNSLRSKASRVGEKRDSSSSDEDSDCPETPVAGRRKRNRDWRWTLGPVSGAAQPDLSPNRATSSEDSSC